MYIQYRENNLRKKGGKGMYKQYRENNVRKKGGKRMYKQYRQKNDSTILVTTKGQKENKNQTSKLE
jgi:hypothetical protein